MLLRLPPAAPMEDSHPQRSALRCWPLYPKLHGGKVIRFIRWRPDHLDILRQRMPSDPLLGTAKPSGIRHAATVVLATTATLWI
jgi:hypothetical protein